VGLDIFFRLLARIAFELHHLDISFSAERMSACWGKIV